MIPTKNALPSLTKSMLRFFLLMYSSNDVKETMQLARSDSRAHVRGTIRRQARSKALLAKGEYLQIQKGPHQGTVGIFKSQLKGNWAVLKRLDSNQDILVDMNNVARFPPSSSGLSSKTKRRKIVRRNTKDVMKDVMGIFLGEAFSGIK